MAIFKKQLKIKNFSLPMVINFFNRPGPRLIESLEIFAEIINPSFFNFNHEGTGWINYND